MQRFYRLCAVLLSALLFPVLTWSQQQPAATKEPTSMDFPAAWKVANEQFISPAVQAYAQKYVLGETWDDQGVRRQARMPEDKAILECVTAIIPSPTQARMVFVINDKGIVTEAHTDQTGWIAECMTSKLVGHRVPPPPHAPLYYCSRYEKTGDNSTETSTCGPETLVSLCEQKGMTKRCTFKVR